jgi:predicted ArsR family transcriptional regulator
MSARMAGKGQTRDAVLAYLVREADMDGVATTTSAQIAAAIGGTTSNANSHLHNLIADGSILRVEQVERAWNEETHSYAERYTAYLITESADV